MPLSGATYAACVENARLSRMNVIAGGWELGRGFVGRKTDLTCRTHRPSV
jgi:hypothetical protein